MSRVALWLTLLLVLAFAACGGESSADEQQPAPPGIPAGVAQDLADQADGIAATLESGDVCGAAHQADELLAAATDAINSGDVPTEFQESLLGTAQKLQADINCPPPADEDVEEEEDEDEDREEGESDEEKGKGRGKGKDKKEGEGGDEATTLLDTTTTVEAG